MDYATCTYTLYCFNYYEAFVYNILGKILRLVSMILLLSIGGGGYHGGSKDHSELSQLKVSGMAGVVKEQKLMDLSIKGMLNCYLIENWHYRRDLDFCYS